MKTDVVIAPCADYSEAETRRALKQALEPFDGLSWVKPGMRIAIKANLVSFLKPEKAATTRPALLCQLVKMLSECGADVVVGDSPGGLYNAAFVSRVYAATGMKAVTEAGGRLNQNFTEKDAEFPEAADGHDLRSEKHVWGYSGHDEAGIPFSISGSQRFCPYDRGFE